MTRVCGKDPGQVAHRDRTGQTTAIAVPGLGRDPVPLGTTPGRCSVAQRDIGSGADSWYIAERRADGQGVEG